MKRPKFDPSFTGVLQRAAMASCLSFGVGAMCGVAFVKAEVTFLGMIVFFLWMVLTAVFSINVVAFLFKEHTPVSREKSDK